MGRRPLALGVLGFVGGLAALTGLAGLTGLAVLIGFDSAVSAQAGPSIEVSIADDGEPVSEVTVDLFAQGPDGERDGWLTSAETDAEGRAVFAVAPACYVITAIAPPGFDFGSEGRWSNRAVCALEPRPYPIAVSIEGPSEAPRILAVVERPDGFPVNGVTVDLFAVSGDGGRGTFITSSETGADGKRGTASFVVQPACYVVTFVAPDDERFASPDDPEGARWVNRPVCVSGGDAVVPVTLLPNRTAIGGYVYGSGQVEGVQVDLFSADNRGNRLSWVATTTTGPGGRVEFDVDPGCWSLTYIAPDELTFPETNSGFVNRWACIGQRTVWELSPVALAEVGPTGAEVGGQVSYFDDRAAPGAVVDFFEPTADGQRGTWLGQAVTDRFGRFRFDTPPGCLVMTYVAPAGTRFVENEAGWLNRSLCVEAGPVEVSRVYLEVAGAPDLTAPAPLADRVEVASWTVEGELPRWEGGIYQPPLLSEDGTTAAFTTGRYGDNMGLRTRNVDQAEEVTISDGHYWLEVVDISADGRAVLYRQRTTSDADEELRLWTGERSVVVPDEVGGSVNLAADGTEVAGLSSNADVATASFWRPGQNVRPVVIEGPSGFMNPVYVDDNSSLVFQSFPGEEEGPGPDIHRYDFDTGQTAMIDLPRSARADLTEAVDRDLVRLGGVGWARFSTGEVTRLRFGAQDGWFTYPQDFDLSADGSTYLYPQRASLSHQALYRPATGQIVGIPYQGREDHADLSGDGRRVLVGEPLSDTSYRLTVLLVE